MVENKEYIIYVSFVFVLSLIVGYFMTVKLTAPVGQDNPDLKTVNFKGIEEIPCDRISKLDDVTLPSDKPEFNNSIKIVALGDSFTEGGYPSLPKNETYTTILENMLNSNSSRKFEVLNFARGGFTMDMKVKTFKKNVKFNPDIIILQYWPGDNWNYERLRENFINSLKNYCKKHDIVPEDMVIKFHRSAYLKERKIIEKNRTQKINSSLLNPVRSLDKLANGTEKIFLIVSPSDIKIRKNEKRMRKLVSNLGWEIIDMRKTYEKYPPGKIKVSENNPHATKFAQKLIAERVLPKIENITEYGRETLG